MPTRQPLLEEMMRRCSRRPDGQLALACAEAFALAEEFDLPVEQIGALCDEHEVKIAGCQLGCFP